MRQDGQLSWKKVRGCVGGAHCHFVVEQVFSGAFEEAIRWYAVCQFVVEQVFSVAFEEAMRWY